MTPLYDLLTGHPPFFADDANALRRLHAYAPIQRLEQRVPDLPFVDLLEPIVGRALAKKRDARFQSAGEMIAALLFLAALRVGPRQALGDRPALGFGAAARPVSAQGNLAALGAPANPKVVVTWDRYYDHAAVGDIARAGAGISNEEAVKHLSVEGPRVVKQLLLDNVYETLLQTAEDGSTPFVEDEVTGNCDPSDIPFGILP